LVRRRSCIFNGRSGTFSSRNYRLTIDDLENAFPKPAYIVLYRQNIAEQYVSQKAAELTKQWILLPGQERKRATVSVNPAAFKQHCAETHRGYEEVLAHPAIRERGVVLTYDELTIDPSRCVNKVICPLLAVPPAQPTSQLCKQSFETLSERVANYADVETLLNSPIARLQLPPIGQSLRARAA
jgi:LPS sulfotransferase NodH